MKPLNLICFAIFISSLFGCTTKPGGNIITTGTLLSDLVDLSRLTEIPADSYSVQQYSSYDRRSSHPGNPGWFQNSDGFGGEPIPGYLETLEKPDENGIGEYLICDVEGPGAIVRTWTARINGEISLFFDSSEEPFYSGSAQEFHWNSAGALSGDGTDKYYESIFRQNDGCYFPVPFSKRCRITWKGDIKELHFYHIEIRSYDKGTDVVTFQDSDLEKYKDEIENVGRHFTNLAKTDGKLLSESKTIGKGIVDTLYSLSGPGVIKRLAIKVEGGKTGKSLRGSLLKIYFDGASIPQVNSPVGDFFGAAPGVNPFGSVPFTVSSDGIMECRFHMPFRNSAVIVIENRTDESVRYLSGIEEDKYDWNEDRSLHFRAKWRIDRGLSASNTDIQDIPYILALGKGRFVGVSAFLMNPTNVPTSWGNWWGEGDEKVFVDTPEKPVFIGTGSEDYFNYSWSSAALFDYAFCGQPRNDGPANRGFVTNYRFQISDDIPFCSSFAFFMELLHHGRVEGFDYARISYYYATPETIDDVMDISDPDIESQEMPVWKEPVGYLGSANATFVESEDIVSVYPADRLNRGYLWSGGEILYYQFNVAEEKIYLRLDVEEEGPLSVNLVLAHSPESGRVRIYIDGYRQETAVEVELYEEFGLLSRSHSLGRVTLPEGRYKIIVENLENGPNRTGLDFLWFRKT